MAVKRGLVLILSLILILIPAFGGIYELIGRFFVSTTWGGPPDAPHQDGNNAKQDEFAGISFPLLYSLFCP